MRSAKDVKKLLPPSHPQAVTRNWVPVAGGRPLACFRYDGGLSIRQLAALSGVSRNEINLLERGLVRWPRVQTALRLARALGKEESELWPGIEEHFAQQRYRAGVRSVKKS